MCKAEVRVGVAHLLFWGCRAGGCLVLLHAQQCTVRAWMLWGLVGEEGLCRMKAQCGFP